MKRRLRSVSLVTVGVLAGVVLLSPVAAHEAGGLGHWWRGHIKPRIIGQVLENRLGNPDGAVNEARDPVDWTKLKSVPDGFADGVDDVGTGGATDLECAGCVGTGDLADDAVTSAKVAANTLTAADLAFDPATQAELDALGADDGIVNQVSDPVSWTKLKDIPAGFADGVDNVSGGSAADVVCTGCVGSTDVLDNDLAAIDLAANSVGASELTDASVVGGVGGDVSDNSLTAADLAPDSVGSSEIATGSVGTDEILNGTIVAADVAANTLTASELATGSVGTDEILNGTIVAADVAADTLTASELADNSVGAGEIATGAVGTAEVADAAVTIAKLAPGLAGTVSIDPASIAAASCALAAVTVTGILATDTVFVMVPDNLETGLDGEATTPQADTLRVRICNHTAAAVDGAARTWTYLALR